MTESVVLLHGIARTNASMRGLQERLEQEGYRVLNIDYPSRSQHIEALADSIHPQIEAFLKGTQGPVHFVGHSMGGLVINAYLASHPTERAGRVVMLGTPNRGSKIADMLRDTLLYKYFYGPAGQQLCTDNAPCVPSSAQLGVIAGTWAHPLGSLILGEESDGTVAVSSTRPDGPHQHVKAHSGHAFMPNNKVVQAQVVRFLHDGKFDEPEATPRR